MRCLLVVFLNAAQDSPLAILKLYPRASQFLLKGLINLESFSFEEFQRKFLTFFSFCEVSLNKFESLCIRIIRKRFFIRVNVEVPRGLLEGRKV